MIAEMVKIQAEFQEKLKSTFSPSAVETLRGHGITSEAKLRELLETNRILSFNGFGFKRANKARQLVGLEPLARRMPRPKAFDFPLFRKRKGQALFESMVPLDLQFKVRAGVYVLRLKNQSMYVGETLHVLQRIASHVSEKPQFDSVLFLEIPNPTKAKLLDAEASLIAFLNPPWNGTSGR